MTLSGLCLVVTDPVTSYETVAEAAVKAGLGYLQLRMKRAPRAEILATAKRLRAITRGTDTCFIVNDDPALAAEAEADGVHLGQGDLPLPEARAAFPGLRLFGLSTHSFAQMRAAEAVSPDYIGVGPLYATPTKAIPDPTLGPDEAGRIIRARRRRRRHRLRRRPRRLPRPRALRRHPPPPRPLGRPPLTAHPIGHARPHTSRTPPRPPRASGSVLSFLRRSPLAAATPGPGQKRESWRSSSAGVRRRLGSSGVGAFWPSRPARMTLARSTTGTGRPARRATWMP